MKRIAVVCIAFSSACAADPADGGTQGSASGSSHGEESEGSEEASEGAGTDGATSSTEGSSADDGSAAPQPEVCAQMFRCLGDVAPELAAPLLELYGEQGSCWQLAADEQAICESACEAQLQLAWDAGLWDAQLCSGAFEPERTGKKGPEETDAACSDGFDNDGNGFVDCDDFGCTMNPGVTVCDSGSTS